MNAENTKKLYEKYPLIYSGHTRPMSESLMCFGFEVGDGWFELLNTFSAMAEAYAQHHEMNSEVVQVKEKFGGLRIYIEPGDDALYNFTHIIENESYRTCEVCGIRNNEYDEKLNPPKTEKFVQKSGGAVLEKVDILLGGDDEVSGFAKVTTGPLVPGSRGWIITRCEYCRNEELKRRASAKDA